MAQRYSLPEDIRLWQESDVLYALSQFTGDSFGGWLVGDENYQRWIAAAPPEAVTDDEKRQTYVQLSREALAGEVMGSSAGGEQPKFSCFSGTASGAGCAQTRLNSRIYWQLYRMVRIRGLWLSGHGYRQELLSTGGGKRADQPDTHLRLFCHRLFLPSAGRGGFWAYWRPHRA
jgi:hypothetical protein